MLFVTTVEEVLERIGLEQLDQVRDQLFAVLAKCVASEHFQVAERALYIWNNEKLALVRRGCSFIHYGNVHSCSPHATKTAQEVFHPQRASLLLPYVFNSLYRNAQGHWNHNVETMSQSILKMYADEDSLTYEQCLKRYQVRRAMWDFSSTQLSLAFCMRLVLFPFCFHHQEEEPSRQARQEVVHNKWAAFAAQAPADVKPIDGPVLSPPRPVIGIQETKLT